MATINRAINSSGRAPSWLDFGDMFIRILPLTIDSSFDGLQRRWAFDKLPMLSKISPSIVLSDRRSYRICSIKSKQAVLI